MSRLRHLLTIFGILLYTQKCLGKIGKVPSYNIGQSVPVSLNTVGPYRNPNEKYQFLKKVPFCQPKSKKKDKAGSAFFGDRPTVSDYELPFRETISEPKIVCEKTLDQNDIKKYMDMIHENYMFELFVDHELLVTGFLGKEEEEDEEFMDHEHEERYFFLFTHWNFHCEYNDVNVISCRITTDLDKKVELQFGENIKVEFTYSVVWDQTPVKKNDRLMYHVRKLIKSQPLEVHWLSTLNSFILVLLVTGFVALVFTTILRNDCRKYHQYLTEEIDDFDDFGWKQLTKDIFRSPKYPMLFSSLIGAGTQLLVLIISILVLSLIGLFYPGNRGSLTRAIIIIYILTAGISGHVSGKLYKQFGGINWTNNAILTFCIFPVPFCVIFMFVNTVSVIYQSSMALPFIYIFGPFIMYIILGFPLTGYFAWRISKQEINNPYPTSQINKVPREIPEMPWYKNSYLIILISGILPFTSIYIELHFLFMAIFGHQVYTLFGILSLAFIMLLIVTSAVTIGLIYFQLQSEDWRWWWKAFFIAGSPGYYIFCYAIFYYKYRSYMSGILQATYFFGYITVLSYSFILLLGATGWWAAYFFLNKIYAAIKSD
mmetsp:Transcript_37344/g.46138  ORF Transcript_37344/g.46138 Transcript_37344/m.46138 type:complete len:599 (-) Transcript_37344:127-1923(-)